MKGKYYPIAMGISKKNIPKIKRDLQKQGYSKFTTIKDGRYYNLYYSLKKRLAKKRRMS